MRGLNFLCWFSVAIQLCIGFELLVTFIICMMPDAEEPTPNTNSSIGSSNSRFQYYKDMPLAAKYPIEMDFIDDGDAAAVRGLEMDKIGQSAVFSSPRRKSAEPRKVPPSPEFLVRFDEQSDDEKEVIISNRKKRSPRLSGIKTGAAASFEKKAKSKKGKGFLKPFDLTDRNILQQPQPQQQPLHSDMSESLEKNTSYILERDRNHLKIQVPRPLSLDSVEGFDSTKAVLSTASPFPIPLSLESLSSMSSQEILSLFMDMNNEVKRLRLQLESLRTTLNGSSVAGLSATHKQPSQKQRNRSAQLSHNLMHDKVTLTPLLSGGRSGKVANFSTEEYETVSRPLQAASLDKTDSIEKSKKYSRLSMPSSHTATFSNLNAAFPYEDLHIYTGIFTNYSLAFYSRFPRFSLLDFKMSSKPIGSGTYADVFRVQHKATREVFALKRFHMLTFKIQPGEPNPMNSLFFENFFFFPVILIL
jgi:hypothetical protein